MPEDAAQALWVVNFLDSSSFSHNRAPVDRRYYMALGYRRSGHKMPLAIVIGRSEISFRATAELLREFLSWLRSEEFPEPSTCFLGSTRSLHMTKKVTS